MQAIRRPYTIKLSAVQSLHNLMKGSPQSPGMSSLSFHVGAGSPFILRAALTHTWLGRPSLLLSSYVTSTTVLVRLNAIVLFNSLRKILRKFPMAI